MSLTDGGRTEHPRVDAWPLHIYKDGEQREGQTGKRTIAYSVLVPLPSLHALIWPSPVRSA